MDDQADRRAGTTPETVAGSEEPNDADTSGSDDNSPTDGGGNDSEDEETAETTTTEQTTDGTPESDGGPPDDRGGDPETDTESTGVDPGTEPAEASAEATAEANHSASDGNDAPDQSEETETDPTVSDGAIADRLTGANPSNDEGTEQRTARTTTMRNERDRADHRPKGTVPDVPALLDRAH